MSIFSENAKRYLEAGYSVVPIQPGGKRPGFVRGNNGALLRRWQQWCDTAVSGATLKQWIAGDIEAGIGIALGYNNVVAIDLDYGSKEINSAIESCMPESPYKKIGSKGYTAFYRTSLPMKAKKFNIRLNEDDRPMSVCEVLSRGNQTVIPPTIHPDTKRAYNWDGDPLSIATPDQLPELPMDFPERVAEALKPFGYVSKSQSHKAGEYATEHSSMYSDLNRDALAGLDLWVPSLNRVDIDPNFGGAGYRIMASWRGGDDYNIGIDPAGIKDFTEKDGNDGSMSPIDLVCYMHDITPGDAFGWLFSLVYAEFNKIIDEMVVNGLKKQSDKRISDAREFNALQRRLETIEAEEILKIEEDTKLSFDASRLPEEIRAMIDGAVPISFDVGSPNDIADSATGLLGDMVSYLTSVSDTPSKTIALTASLGISALLFGRWWYRKGNNNHKTFANIYVFGSAGSGMGKSSTMNTARGLYDEAIDLVMRDPDYNGAKGVNEGDDGCDDDGAQKPQIGEILHGSYYGKTIHAPATLQNRLISYPNMLMFVDEASQFVRKVWPERQNNNADGMQRQLKMLITEADGRADGTDYTVKDKNQHDVQMPGFSMVLMSTGDELIKSLPLETYRDGMLGRVLWLQDSSKPKLCVSKEYESPLRRKIVRHMASILKTRLDAKDMSLGGFTGSDSRYDPVFVPSSSVAIDVEESTKRKFFDEGVRAAAAKRPDSELWHRALEVAIRAALLHALGVDHVNPEISDVDMKFGIKLAVSSLSQLAYNADRAEGQEVHGAVEYTKIEARVIRLITRNGGSLTASKLSQGLSMRRHDLDAILYTLNSAKRITITNGSRSNSQVVELV